MCVLGFKHKINIVEGGGSGEAYSMVISRFSLGKEKKTNDCVDYIFTIIGLFDNNE